MIDFHLDGRSGVPPYLQLVQQVKHALRVGILRPGDQLPTVRDVVANLAINPNTVAKAYRELELEGLIGGRPGQGTFVTKALPGPSAADLATLRFDLDRWLSHAFAAGLDDESILALVAASLRESTREKVA
ncbi:MAG TPA: GntR family transcriptional regulator [Thermomicrobiales bacterium]|nr:GntR family transcriptional regulator [Thermomicrobiales bacterium]